MKIFKVVPASDSDTEKPDRELFTAFFLLRSDADRFLRECSKTDRYELKEIEVTEQEFRHLAKEEIERAKDWRVDRC